MDDAAECARQSQDVLSGHMRVTEPIDLSIDVLPDLVVRFRQLHPHISVELLITDASLDLAVNRVDLELRANIEGLLDMGYRASKVAYFSIGLYDASDYIAANGGGPDAPLALAGHAMVESREFTGAAKLLLTDKRGRSE